MGGIVFNPGGLNDCLSEQAGIKAGLALSLRELAQLFVDSRFEGLLPESETQSVRLRSEDYDDLVYTLLHRVGHTPEKFDGDVTGAYVWHKYADNRDVVASVTDLLLNIWPALVEEAERSGSKQIDPTAFVEAAADAHGPLGRRIALERVLAIGRGQRLSPHSGVRFVEWADIRPLEDLFRASGGAPAQGKFFDQRFIDFLAANTVRLDDIHWRKFEELTAEFFAREGYRVELGPGTNDDGVDIRVWHPAEAERASPSGLIQCKRQKAKVEKVIIKGLYADVAHEGAQYGVIATTSELSKGSRSTIQARGYPIDEIDRPALEKWLVQLRSPGTGIVRL